MRTNDSAPTVSGLLMIHEPEHVAALCALVSCNQSLSRWITRSASSKKKKTGVELDPVKVQEARQLEDLDNIEQFGVCTVITLSEARQRGLKLVCAKWLDDIKTVDGDPTAVRSRLVATEINSLRGRMSTSPFFQSSVPG